MANKVLFSYHRDPEDPNRVITLARQVTSGTDGKRGVMFQLAICSPKRDAWYRHGDALYLLMRENTGDVFKKSRGREIALGRLETHPLFVTGDAYDDMHPLDQIRHYLVDDVDEFIESGALPRFVHRTFAHELDVKDR